MTCTRARAGGRAGPRVREEKGAPPTGRLRALLAHGQAPPRREEARALRPGARAAATVTREAAVQVPEAAAPAAERAAGARGPAPARAGRRGRVRVLAALLRHRHEHAGVEAEALGHAAHLLDELVAGHLLAREQPEALVLEAPGAHARAVALAVGRAARDDRPLVLLRLGVDRADGDHPVGAVERRGQEGRADRELRGIGLVDDDRVQLEVAGVLLGAVDAADARAVVDADPAGVLL